MNYYNEHDPNAAAWLREMIAAGEIPAGDVDERSILDVRADDLTTYIQCHFFAGIGGWSLALRLAGWPAERPVWTGSCPCQPFSCTGQGRGEADERHLWPVFAGLIRAAKPATVFGEQVASKAGRGWLAGVFADLEGMGYHRAGADLCAAGVHAPHIRQRLYWVADRPRHGREWREDSAEPAGWPLVEVGGANGRVGDSFQSRLEGQSGNGDDRGEPGRLDPRAVGSTAPAVGDGFWSAYDIVHCRDGKARRIEPGTFPLVDGFPARVAVLKGFGNAIVPQVAAEFVQAFTEINL